MEDKEVTRGRKKLVAVEKAQRNLNKRNEDIDWELDVLLPKIAAFKRASEYGLADYRDYLGPIPIEPPKALPAAKKTTAKRATSKKSVAKRKSTVKRASTKKKTNIKKTSS